MDISITDKELERLASDAAYAGGYSERVTTMFRQALQIAAAVRDETDLSRFKCLRYRKARGRGAISRIALTEDADLLVRLQNGRAKPELIVEQIIAAAGRKK